MNEIYYTEQLFESWIRRKLSLIGKACIVKTMAISKLIYVALILFGINQKDKNEIHL